MIERAPTGWRSDLRSLHGSRLAPGGPHERRARRLRERLREFRAALPEGVAETRQQIDASDEARLEALGYVETGEDEEDESP